MAVAHDSRNNSRKFAERVADIFASNGFTTLPVRRAAPDPRAELRHPRAEMPLGRGDHRLAQPQGVQRLQGLLDRRRPGDRPHDRNIIEEVGRITDVGMIRTGSTPENIVVLGEDFDEKVPRPHPRAFALAREREAPPRHEDRLHAAARAGVRLVPASLRRFGFTNVTLVPEQSVVDGNFPTVESPNPEERKTMSKAIELAAREGADLVLATDPDSDRIGVALRNKQGEYVLLNGNQTLVLLASYQLTRWAELGLARRQSSMW